MSLTSQQIREQFVAALNATHTPISVLKARLVEICDGLASGATAADYPGELTEDHATMLEPILNPPAPPTPDPKVVAKRELAASDADMARVTEDIWALIKSNLGLADEDLPAEAAAKLAYRKARRDIINGE